MLSHCVIRTPIGSLEITAIDNQLTKIDFVEDKIGLIAPQTPLLSSVSEQLQNYFKNPNFIFNVSYHVIGTPFQRRVWTALSNLKPGETLTYGELAKLLGTGPRAIGQACRTNPLPIIVPCHRIVASNHIGGFAGNIRGRYASIKTWLIAHEKQ